MAELPEFGDLFFLYTPKPGVSPVRGPGDVYELAIVLSPDADRPRRLLVVPERRLPEPALPGRAAGQPVVAAVVAARERPEELVELFELRAQTAPGATAGPLPTARPCGEGRYAIVGHQDHTHFAYALELPVDLGSVQRDLGLAREASYRATVRVPATARGRGLRPAVFHPGQVVPVLDPDLLAVTGSELFLQPDPDLEQLPITGRTPESAATAELFAQLKLRSATSPTDPLYRGEWR